MIGLLLAGTAAAVALLRRQPKARVIIRDRRAIGACCSQCAADQAAGTMPYGHTCTPCGQARICPAWSPRRVDAWVRAAAEDQALGPTCVAACDAIYPAVLECLRRTYPVDGYGDPIDWERVPYDGSPLDLLRLRTATRLLARCGALTEMREQARWVALGRPTEGDQP